MKPARMTARQNPNREKTWTEISNIEVGINPHDLALSPDHKTAYVTIYGSGIYGNNPNPEHSIAIIDLASRSQTGGVNICSRRGGAARGCDRERPTGSRNGCNLHPIHIDSRHEFNAGNRVV